ncbi:tetrahydrofolylpolyglutamate synthase [Xylariomycetidae sp. FL0641]|nr:tetrahydrofolylpolyglutamate synthase [Xylariomycetidae sp. FL0641]
MQHVFRCLRYAAFPSSSLNHTIIYCFFTRRRTMATQTGRTYNDAIDALNSLQTPYAVFQARVKAGIRPDAASIAEMHVYLRRIGYTLDDLDRLNVLHVAGTKGKGSTCAFAASILAHHQRAHGTPRRVGLFTSPHLVAVRERIRIDGAPLDEARFARYFFEVWEALGRAEAAEGPVVGLDPRLPDVPMPARPIYARFLTLLSWHVFLREGVGAAVYETGIGGEFDVTNLVRRPLAAAVTTLAVDHVFALGDSVDKIAWHKAGIMKPGRPAYTVAQVPAAAAVLAARARERGADLQVLGVDPRLRGVHVRPDALFQKRNATLGVALAEAALAELDPAFRRDPAALPRDFVDGLEQVVWRGRCEVKADADGGVVWHIDGAHTIDSLAMATRWFADVTSPARGPRALIFNQQGREEAVGFLRGIHDALAAGGREEDDHDNAQSRRSRGRRFEHVVFCSNVTYAAQGYKRDFVNFQHDPAAVQALTAQHAFAARWRELDPEADVVVLPTIEHAINHVRALQTGLPEGETVQAFITGSLHLVGGALGILEGGAEAL